MHFDNVEVPVENRLGEEGEGFKLAEKWLVEGRVPYAAATHRHRAGGARAGDRLGEAARNVRLAAVGEAGDPVDDRRQRDGAARRAPAGLSGRVEGRSRARTSSSKPRSPRSLRRKPPAAWSTAASRCSAASACRRRCRWSAGIASCASSASARARRRCSAWWSRATCWRAEEAACRSTGRRSTDGIATITINRARAAQRDGRRALRGALAGVAARARRSADPCAIVTGAGEKSFSAGADIKSFLTGLPSS